VYFYHLAYQLKRAEHASALALEKAVSPLGVTLAQANVLLFIDRFPGATVTQLASVAAVATPTMHRFIVTLQKMNLMNYSDCCAFTKMLFPRNQKTKRRSKEMKQSNQIKNKKPRLYETQLARAPLRTVIARR